MRPFSDRAIFICVLAERHFIPPMQYTSASELARNSVLAINATIRSGRNRQKRLENAMQFQRLNF